MPEKDALSEQPKKKDDLAEIVRRSLLGAQHLKDIEEHARELAKLRKDRMERSLEGRGR